MKVGALKIGDTQARNNLFLAPIAGFTDYSFRKLILPLGVGLCFTELVSAKGLYYGGKNSETLLYCGEDYENTAAQIFGSDPYYMRWACESKYLEKFRIIDVNMGCPVPKIVKNGEGSALLNDIKKAESVIKEMVRSGKNITVKIRTGIKRGDDIAREFSEMAEYCGAKLITIHGRVREAYYSGEPDYDAIARAKKAVSIPVIANGGIFTKEDADLMTERTGADGVMIARGAIADPFIFSKISGENPPIKTLKEFALAHFDEEIARIGENRAAVEFRKFVTYYFKGAKNSKQNRVAIMTTEDVDEIKRLISETL